MLPQTDQDLGPNPAKSSVKPERFFAHTLDGQPQEAWQPLRQHLEQVGQLAASFASSFEAAEWARLLGRWHDIGKYSDAFQHYLRQASKPDPHTAEQTLKVDHSTAGAQHAVASVPLLGHLMAFAIAGHHAGLPDAKRDGTCLELRLAKTIEPWDNAPDEFRASSPLGLPRHLLDRRDPFALAFFCRMLFSSLVDADFLDTEAFMSPERSEERFVWPKELLPKMSRCLDEFIGRFPPPTDRVNLERAKVYRACAAAAPSDPGFFSLTVPTGGGKTLSSLTFALRHAIEHGQSRVIYVVPFTSIIEQNATVFAEAMAPLSERMGIPLVIEHHSNLDPEIETTSSRLAVENWDAPLVVTTSVQFYESLFANRTSRCRKLHNVANSVIVLDEVQTLPVDYLQPCLVALEELVLGYHCSVVLCTATQPTLGQSDSFPIGLPRVREIIPDPLSLQRALDRVDVEVLGPVNDSDLAKTFLQSSQALCIVNTRRHAQEIADAIGASEDHFHLSASMCPAHRSSTLDTIRQRLRLGQPCRVVSTQLVEAGVDIDFPVVFRSMAGLDSIAQAAGRCNRNGRLERGVTYLFESEHRPRERFLNGTSNCTRQLLPLYSDRLLSLEANEHFFRLYYWENQQRWDQEGLLQRFQLNQHPNPETARALPFLFGFRSVAEDFRLIDGGVPVLVPWGQRGERLCQQLRNPFQPPSRRLLRQLQRFVVQIHRRQFDEHQGSFDLAHGQYPVLASPELHYSDRFGLVLDGAECLIF